MKVKKYMYSFPILKEKIDEWKSFAQKVNGEKNEEFTKMHKRIGVTKELWFLKEKKDSYEVLVYTEAVNDNFMELFKEDTSEFSEWFKANVEKTQKIDLTESFKMPELVLDWVE
ncbi:hypothetical protein [Tenacibaculum sp. SDUM215027]|uniref:hypothetical protein n=1 Tax=Tenacibaculum sp. SDUM215027 TaxID=3422596 RepID=UPI003D31705E